MENTEKPNCDHVAEVRAIFQEIATMGGNNYEPSAIEEILRALQEGEITGEEAVSRARGIRDSKQAPF